MSPQVRVPGSPMLKSRWMRWGIGGADVGNGRANRAATRVGGVEGVLANDPLDALVVDTTFSTQLVPNRQVYVRHLLAISIS